MIKFKMILVCLVISISLSAQKLDVHGQKMDTIPQPDSVNTRSVKDVNEFIKAIYGRAPQDDYEKMKYYFQLFLQYTEKKNYKIIPHK